MEEVSKKVHPIDAHVGLRVRLRRQMLGISQNELGHQLGVTFQQIQKYEKGANRIGASRLYEIANALNINVQYFYDNVEIAKANLDKKTDNEFDDISAAESVKLYQYFSKIPDHEVRKCLLEFMKVISNEAAGSTASIKNRLKDKNEKPL